MLAGGWGSGTERVGAEAQWVHKGSDDASLGFLMMRHSASQTGSVVHHGALALGQAQIYNHTESLQLGHMVNAGLEFDRKPHL